MSGEGGPAIGIGHIYLGIRVRHRAWARTALRICSRLPRPVGAVLGWMLWPALKCWGFVVTVQ